jgi:SagB-type dehydrogenase family enzyme
MKMHEIHYSNCRQLIGTIQPVADKFIKESYSPRSISSVSAQEIYTDQQGVAVTWTKLINIIISSDKKYNKDYINAASIFFNALTEKPLFDNITYYCKLPEKNDDLARRIMVFFMQIEHGVDVYRDPMNIGYPSLLNKNSLLKRLPVLGVTFPYLKEEIDKILTAQPEISSDYVDEETILSKIQTDKEEKSESLDYSAHQAVEMPTKVMELQTPLSIALLKRETCREMFSRKISLDEITALLYYSYGISHEIQGYPRKFRMVPSGGALYPLEIYFYCINDHAIPRGIYHYNPLKNIIYLIKKGDYNDLIKKGLVFTDILDESSLLIFITAIFERSTLKYRERGYRFIFIEAGHVGQNIALVSSSLGLGSKSIGGYYDKEIDALLDLDGISHSTIYMLAIGGIKNHK